MRQRAIFFSCAVLRIKCSLRVPCSTLLLFPLFSGKTKAANTLHRHMACLGDKITYEIRASIVDVIIGGLFFRDEDAFSDSDSDSDDAADSVARKAEKKGCERRNSLKLLAKNEADPEWYVVVIPNATRFELAMDMVFIGMSFRQTAGAMQLVRELRSRPCSA